MKREDETVFDIHRIIYTFHSRYIGQSIAPEAEFVDIPAGLRGHKLLHRDTTRLTRALEPCLWNSHTASGV
jgi:hypothetical protein